MEVQSEHADVDGHDLDTVGAGDEHAVVGVHALDHADRRVDPGQHLLRRRVDRDAGVDVPPRERHLTEHERGVVVAGQRARGEPTPARGAQRHPVQAVRRPRVVERVAGHHEPAPLPAHQPVRLELPPLAPVVEPELHMVADRRRHLGEQAGVDGGVGDVGSGVFGTGGDRVPQGVDPALQSVREHVLQLGQRAGTGLLDARHRRAGTQPDRDGDRLVLLEQQWWQLGADAEPVAAAGTPDGVHRIAESAQPVDVIADGPVSDTESRGELGTGPVGVGLEQAEQGQHPGRGVRHRSPHFKVTKSPGNIGTKQS